MASNNTAILTKSARPKASSITPLFGSGLAEVPYLYLAILGTAAQSHQPQPQRESFNIKDLGTIISLSRSATTLRLLAHQTTVGRPGHMRARVREFFFEKALIRSDHRNR